MITIVGLGNPGEDYENTRHNAGRMAVIHLAKKHKFTEWEFDKKYESFASEGKVGKESVLLLLPETFMNNSGKAVKNLPANQLQTKKLVVLHDDIDLPLGKFKISFGRGHGGHKGVASIMRALKTKDFWRIRIGVASKKKPEHKKIPDFLLKPMRKPELDLLKKTLKKISEALETMITDAPEKAMNRFN